MATADNSRTMENRGLLTADDRAFFEGQKDVDNADKTRREKRYNVRQRIDRVAEDIEILRDAGEDDLVEDLYDEIGRYERLEKQLRDLREQLEE